LNAAFSRRMRRTRARTSSSSPHLFTRHLTPGELTFSQLRAGVRCSVRFFPGKGSRHLQMPSILANEHYVRHSGSRIGGLEVVHLSERGDRRNRNRNRNSSRTSQNSTNIETQGPWQSGHVNAKQKSPTQNRTPFRRNPTEQN